MQQQLSCAWANPPADPTGPRNRSQLVLHPFSLEPRARWSGRPACGASWTRLCCDHCHSPLPPPSPSHGERWRGGGRGWPQGPRWRWLISFHYHLSLRLRCSASTAAWAHHQRLCQWRGVFCAGGLTLSQNLGAHTVTLLPVFPLRPTRRLSQHRSTEHQVCHVSRTCIVLSCFHPKQSWQPCHAHRVHGLWSL